MSGPLRPSPAPGVVAALARVEGHKLLVHPFFLAGIAFVGIGSAIFLRATLTQPPVSWDDDGWTVAVGFWMLAMMTMVGMNHAALRDRREHTEEQHTSLPAGSATKTGGLLTATLWPAAVTGVLIAAIAGFVSTRGMSLSAVQVVHLAELTGIVVLLGAFGVAVAVWLPNPFVVPLVAFAMFVVHPGEQPRAWHAITPFTDMVTVELAVWHLAYVVGLAALFGVGAIARSTRSRPVLIAGVIVAGIVGVAAAVLLTRACPGACLIG